MRTLHQNKIFDFTEKDKRHLFIEHLLEVSLATLCKFTEMVSKYDFIVITYISTVEEFKNRLSSNCDKCKTMNSLGNSSRIIKTILQ